MAKNDKNKKSYSDVESAARDLLKKLSSQYDAESVGKEKKMADTLSDIPIDENSDERLSTKEFDRIFNEYGTEENEAENIEETEQEPEEVEPETETVQEETPFDQTQDLTVDVSEATDEPEQIEEPVIETEEVEEDAETPTEEVAFEEEPVEEVFEETLVEDAPAEETPAEEETVFEKEYDEEPAPADSDDGVKFDVKEFSSIPDEKNTETDDREDTNVFADRMAGQDTIESFRPAENFEIEDQTGGFVPEFTDNDSIDSESETEEEEERFVKIEDTAEDEYVPEEDTDSKVDTKDTTDTAMMRAFGLDPKKESPEKDDSKKIFDEYLPLKREPV